MLMENADGTFTAGPADVICILQLPGGTFHAAFFEEKPLPGPIGPLTELEFIRLKSKMHHTQGTASLADSQAELDKLRSKISISDANVLRDEAIKVNDPVSVWLVQNWLRGSISLREALPRSE